jgi:uncharacterized membrane protein YcfT
MHMAAPLTTSSLRGGSVPDRRSSPARVAWVDAAKGICIVLVVMMHTTLGLGEALGREGFMHHVVAFAKPFRMPDFFLLSGLFLARVIDRDWKSYADKRVVHFLYFYALWVLIQFAFKGWSLSGGDPAELLRQLALTAVEPFGTLWFIYLLAVFSAVTKLMRRLSPAVLLVAAAALEIAPVHTGSTLIDEFAARYVYFVAGYLFAKRIFAFAARAAERPLLALVGLAAWGVVNGLLAFTPSGVPLFPMLAELPFVSLVLGFAGALAIVSIASLLTHAGLAAPLRYCGEHSIAIYLAFFLPMAAGRALLIKLGLVGDVGVAAAAVTAMAVAAPLILERVVRGTAFDFLFVRPRPFWLMRRARLTPAEYRSA